MEITEISFVRGFIRMCNDGWEQGWHERNGGNLSYRLKPEEVEDPSVFKYERRVEGDRDRCAEAVRGIFYGDRKRKVFPKCDTRSGGFDLHSGN